MRIDRVRAADGARLEMLYIPAVRAPVKPAVLFAHGYLEAKELHAARALRIAAWGHPVVLFDLRAHATAGGAVCTFGDREADDARVVLDAAKSRGWIDGRVIGMGFSTGASIAIRHAARDPRVIGVAALAPFADMPSAAPTFQVFRRAPIDPDRISRAFRAGACRAGFSPDATDARTAIRALHVPVLLAAGERDRLLPPARHAWALAAANPEWTRTVSVPDRGHVGLAHRACPLLEEKLAMFLAEMTERARLRAVGEGGPSTRDGEVVESESEANNSPVRADEPARKGRG